VTKKGRGKATTVLKKPPKINKASVGEDDDSDTPLGAKLAKTKATIEKRAEKEAKAIRKEEKATKANSKKKLEEESDGGDVQASRKKQKKQQPNGSSPPASRKKRMSNSVKREESDDDMPLARKKPSETAAKATPAGKKGKAKAAKIEETEQDREAEAEEEEYHWWDDPSKGDGTTKWTTLEHAGVVFPPPYEPLPRNVKMRYDGTPVSMALEAEEIAGFFGGMLNSTLNVENPTFQKNFFQDFQEMLEKTGGATDRNGAKVDIKEFSKCDFQPIFEYYEGQRAEKKSLPTAEKKRLKAEKDAAEAPYMYCMWDGRKQKVGNFRVEPPGLFRGRGEHPKTGKVKKRVEAEQITINIGKEATVPAPPEGHRWKEIKHDQEGTWLAMWQENINGAYKYVMLAANSDIKGQSDYHKFEKARELKVRLKLIPGA
jgi:DNA topoisomerase-1